MTDKPEQKPADLAARAAELEADIAANRKGPPPPPAAQRLARILAAQNAEERAALGVEGESPLAAFRAWGQENTRRGREAAAVALRDRMADILKRNAPNLAPAVLDALKQWTDQDANPEALITWLERGGWAKVDGDAVEKALVLAARAVVNAEGMKGLSAFVWHEPESPCFVLVYDMARADRNTPEMEARLADRIHPPAGIIAAAFGKEWQMKDAPTVLLGLDALKAGLEQFDWINLALVLTDKAGKAGDWLRRLAGPWMDERRAELQARLDREGTARQLNVLTVRTAAGEYARLPKHAAGISWAFGGAAVELPEGYKAAPNMAALVPPGYAMLRDADLEARAHQTALPLLVDGDDSPPLVLAVTGASRGVFTPAAAALAVYVMASTWDRPEVLQETTLEKLTRAIYPDAPRLRAVHYHAVADALNMMRNARILWPNGYADALFYVPRFTWKTPDAEHLNTPLIVGMDHHFLNRTLPDITAATGIRSLKGQFVFNLTGAMNLDKKRPGLLRQYLRAAATGDAFYEFGSGKPAPSMVPEVDALRWAVLTNYLPSKSGLQGKDARPAGRVAKHDALKRMLADIAALADLKLVKVARADLKAVRLLLTDADLEAWEAFHAGKHRLR